MGKIARKYLIFWLFLFLIILLLGICIGLYFFVSNDKSFRIDDDSKVIYKDNYKININYPIINANNVNKEIQSIIKNEKKDFLKKVKETDCKDNELNINYSYTKNKNIYSIHFRSYSFIDDNYNRIDKMYYIDSASNELIDLQKIIISNEIYEVMEKATLDYIKEHGKALGINDDFEDVIKDNKDVFKYLAFSEEQLLVIIPLYEINSQEIELNIMIDYKYVKEYLNQGLLSTLNKIAFEEYPTSSDRIRDESAFAGKKLVALTFDDGPAYARTRELIEELNKRDARVTFFMLGELANKQKELVKFAYDSGHTIGSHSYDHKNLKKIKASLYSYEIDYTNEILKSIIGEEIKFIRPPYGAYNDDVLNYTDMSFILWSVDTLDWKLRNVNKVKKEIIKGASDGQVILLHDLHKESVEAAIKAVDELQKDGYAFVSLEELIAYKNIDIQGKKVYRSFK